MVLELATVLDVPLRHQNLMLTTAGFTPIYSETDLKDPEMASICKALDFMLQQQEPYPAFVIDRYWNLLLTNNAAKILFNTFIDLETLPIQDYQDNKINLMKVFQLILKNKQFALYLNKMLYQCNYKYQN